MLKILMWVVSNDGRFFQAATNILERQHNGVEVVGVTAAAPLQLSKDGKKIPFVPLAEANTWGGSYDVLLVVGAKQIGMSKIFKAAAQFGFDTEKLLGDWIVCIPGFTLDKYRKLQRSRLSIFSINCFGGLMSNLLGLPFRSPFVNLWINDSDFIKFLRAPRIYLEEQPIYLRQSLNSTGSIEYPVATLGNVELNMLHYKTFEESFNAWEKRKSRINWYNILVEMWTENLESLRQFDALPYGKKICFVPFKSDLDSAWYVNPDINKNESRFADKINQFGCGNPFYYDVFDMLLYGKKTPLIKM